MIFRRLDASQDGWPISSRERDVPGYQDGVWKIKDQKPWSWLSCSLGAHTDSDGWSFLKSALIEQHGKDIGVWEEKIVVMLDGGIKGSWYRQWDVDSMEKAIGVGSIDGWV